LNNNDLIFEEVSSTSRDNIDQCTDSSKRIDGPWSHGLASISTSKGGGHDGVSEGISPRCLLKIDEKVRDGWTKEDFLTRSPLFCSRYSTYIDDVILMHKMIRMIEDARAKL
jgi:hypothetical protein